jgi:DnaJ like chaperone protein
MSWLGKVVGGAFGFIMGGPVGAVLGAAFGHQMDRDSVDLRLSGVGVGQAESHHLMSAFCTALFPIMGNIAKADGRVTDAEIDAARRVMDRLGLQGDSRKAAMQLFADGKHEFFDIDAAMASFLAVKPQRAPLLRTFIELQVDAALGDHGMPPAKEALLLHLCDIARFSRFEFLGIRTRLEAEHRLAGLASGRREQQQRYQPPRREVTPLADAYRTLGLTPTATHADIKRAYRRLVSKHHPDKLAAQGLSEQQMIKATEKTQKIQKAYEAICKSRAL